MALPRRTKAQVSCKSLQGRKSTVLVVSGLILTGLISALVPGQALAADCSQTGVLGKTWVKKWATKYDASRFQIVVKDLKSGCKYTAGKQDKTYPTASTMKLMVAVRVLEQVTAGKFSLNSVKPDLVRMIRVSDDASAQRLLDKVGNKKAISSIAKRYKLKKTKASYSKGTTQTTAAEQVKFINAVIVQRPPSLGEAEYAYLLSLLDSVIASQRWGIGSELPTGWKSRGKNGWYHTRSTDMAPTNRSRVNTIGVVYDENNEPRWILAAFSDNWKTTAQGIAGWKALNKHIVGRLTK